MGRDRICQEYGADQKDIDLVATVLKQYGLTVVSTDAATRAVELSGSVAEMERAFQVKLFEYQHLDGNYRGRVGNIFVPEELKGVVVGVFGLDDRRVARRRRVSERRSHVARSMSSVPAGWYLPAELAKRYNFPPGDGSGQTLGLLEFGGGYFPSDLKQFCGLAGVPEPEVKPISVDGASTKSRDGAEGEVMLDVEVIAGVCPKSKIIIYFAHWGERGWLKALDAAVHDTENKPDVISVSWGNPEDADIWTRQAMDQVNETLKDAAMAGVTVCVAAGDDGSSDADLDGHAHADFPASSPYVLAVGGTAIPKKSAPLPDVFWFEGNGLREQNNPNSGSGGGGVSAVFPRPTWQQSIDIRSVNPGAFEGRCIPDLAANADWTASPYLLCVDNQIQPNGGTSAAAPLIAALIARVNGQAGGAGTVGYLNPVLYQAGPDGQALGLSVCTDVVSGNNTTSKVGGYDARVGYDAVSGWGTPDGAKLANVLFRAVA
jgi:kumamolisin